MAKNYQADVNFLLNVPELKGQYRTAPKPTAHTHRIAQSIRKQLAAGVPVNYEAARGHLVTPEHPNRRRPHLPAGAKVTDYRGGKLPRSKYLKKTIPLEKPIVHKRPINPPERQNLSDGAVVDTFFDTSPTLHRLRAVWDDRVILSGFDCERGVWRQVGVNVGHGKGWTAKDILEKWAASGMDLEDWFIAIANSTDSDPAQNAERIGHVCMWTVYVYPVNRHLSSRAFASAR